MCWWTNLTLWPCRWCGLRGTALPPSCSLVSPKLQLPSRLQASQALRPFGPLKILGMHGNNLWMVDTWGQPQVVDLSHPAIRYELTCRQTSAQGSKREHSLAQGVRCRRGSRGCKGASKGCGRPREIRCNAGQDGQADRTLGACVVYCKLGCATDTPPPPPPPGHAAGPTLSAFQSGSTRSECASRRLKETVLLQSAHQRGASRLRQTRRRQPSWQACATMEHFRCCAARVTEGGQTMKMGWGGRVGADAMCPHRARPGFGAGAWESRPL